ncbi:MAG: nitroreductase family protein [Acidimicrobiales bacterium]|nr:nitroreductase family protein [Acidimicrobiales bacterium]MBO0893792.1 nitroreductase family protein [Acidimicrobiales bacterium]
METWDALTARRNVREYSDKEIPDDVLERILEAGRRAPSASNTQPWDFVVVRGRERLEELAKVWQGAGHVARSNATIAVITPVPENDRRAQLNHFDLGQATMAMMLAAADAGVGSGHSAVGDQDLARSLLGLPDDRICAYLIGLGYPAERPLRPLKRPNRRPLEELVHHNRW